MPRTPAQREYHKQYMYNYRWTEKGYKEHMIDKWKRRGLVETDQYTFEELFEAYACCSECENCGVEFAPVGAVRCPHSKCLDHNHETGVFRDILCHSCNIKRRGIDP